MFNTDDKVIKYYFLISFLGSADDSGAKKRSFDYYKILTAWEIARYKKGKKYIVPLTFKKKGLYYIHIYTDDREITAPTGLNTKGKSPCSGIVIEVD